MQLALQDVKDGFAGLGPISDEGDRVTLVRLYLVGLSYAMGIVPVGKEAVGKTRRGEEALFLFVVVSVLETVCFGWVFCGCSTTARVSHCLWHMACVPSLRTSM